MKGRGAEDAIGFSDCGQKLGGVLGRRVHNGCTHGVWQRNLSKLLYTQEAVYAVHAQSIAVGRKPGGGLVLHTGQGSHATIADFNSMGFLTERRHGLHIVRGSRWLVGTHLPSPVPYLPRVPFQIGIVLSTGVDR